MRDAFHKNMGTTTTNADGEFKCQYWTVILPSGCPIPGGAHSGANKLSIKKKVFDS